MFRFTAVACLAGLCLVPPGLAQPPAKVDFARDVQPIFRQNCIGCHGPNKQINGFRVDRRSSVLKPGSRRVQPGSSENSFLLHRLTGVEYGMQMPPTGPLRPEQIQIIRAWIDQGADWPDSLANEIELPPLDPKAVSLVETLRAADRPAIDKLLAAGAGLLNARGPEGSTPFMYAVLYTDARTLDRLLKQGADPNRHNDAGATALIWAASDLEKTRLLVAHGADVNAKSADSRTALMIAAGRTGGLPIVQFLLAHGAHVNPTTNPGAESSPLLEAALAGEPEILQVLLDRGADYKDVAGLAISLAAGADCTRCIDLLMARKLEPMQYTTALQLVAVADNPKLVRSLIQHGADVNAADPTGRTPLMYAAIADLLPLEQIQLLIEKGANVNATVQHKGSGDSGRTALDIARFHGHTAVVDALLKAGATSAVPEAPGADAPRRGNTIHAAIPASLPLLQRADASFMPKAGCFSCHNNSLTAMAVGLARKKGFAVDEKISAQQVHANAGALAGIRDLLHQGLFVPDLNANAVILAYVLLGLDAEGYKPDLSTDAVAMYLQTHQMADGHWALGPESRPPLCTETAVSETALAMRGLQLYAPRVDKAVYAKSIRLAATWIGEFRPVVTYDVAWRLQGLVWAGTDKEAIVRARRDQLALQRADGGWSDLPTMESGAYTTGLAMVALEGAGLPVSDAAYRRGVEYLLSTQLEDGSWHVHTRAAGFQPYFDNGFPHGVDQWISAAGSGMATMALTLAAPAAGHSVAGPPPER